MRKKYRHDGSIAVRAMDAIESLGPMRDFSLRAECQATQYPLLMALNQLIEAKKIIRMGDYYLLPSQIFFMRDLRGDTGGLGIPQKTMQQSIVEAKSELEAAFGNRNNQNTQNKPKRTKHRWRLAPQKPAPKIVILHGVRCVLPS